MDNAKVHNVKSINASMADELSMVPLDERVELSPVGVLDVLLAFAVAAGVDELGGVYGGCGTKNLP